MCIVICVGCWIIVGRSVGAIRRKRFMKYCHRTTYGSKLGSLCWGVVVEKGVVKIPAKEQWSMQALELEADKDLRMVTSDGLDTGRIVVGHRRWRYWFT